MALPQFTGETSLYRSSSQYIAAPVGVLARGAAIPRERVLTGASAALQPAFLLGLPPQPVSPPGVHWGRDLCALCWEPGYARTHFGFCCLCWGGAVTVSDAGLQCG